MVFTKSTTSWCPSPLRKSLKASVSSDAQMESRKAEFAKRREQAVAFINRLSGSSLPSYISEGQFQESLRDGVLLLQMLNKILSESHQDAVKVVHIDSESNPEAHTAYQTMENISNFLIRVKAMNPELQLFEASDFEEKGNGPSRTARVVDCILDLELWYSEQQRGQTLSTTSWWKQNPALPALSPLVTQSRSTLFLDVATTACGHPDFNPGHAKTTSGDVSGLARLMLASPAMLPSPRTPFAPHLQPLPATPASPFSDVVGSVLGSGHPAHIDIDGIARRLEIFVEACKQEFDNLKYVKEEQMLKLKEALMDALKSDEMHQSRGRMLEALIEGQGEEVQVVSEQLQQAQEEQARVAREKRRLREELIRTHRELDLANQRIAKLEEEGPRKTAACQEREARTHAQLLRAAGELQALKRALVDTKTEAYRIEAVWHDHLRSLEGQMRELACVTQGYQKVLDENRKLYNEVQDLKGNIRVYCRVRPLHSHERTRPSCVEFTGPNGDIMVASSVKPNSCRGFSFDKVFGPGTSQEAIFADTRPLIRSVLDGYNVCIFAYGQTGSGKTFTMAGPNNPSQTDWGVNVRALNDLFGLGSERSQTMRYEVGVQMVEIYNEQVRDLLDSTGGGPRSLEIRNSSQVDGLNVPDATKVPVCSTADVLRLMDLGMRNRAVACTSLNERSSRSHSVLTVHVYGQEVLSGAILRGCLHLVDLAGSERVDRSEATGDRLREAQHINKSLSALGDVIAALASKSAHVPYRNSKLTQLLQDALGKQAKTLMFVHVSPDEESYGETVSTLTFAKRVASVELGASSRNAESAELRESREKIANLKDELQRKAAEVERLQQLKAEAVNRANALAAAAAPARAAPDRRLSEGGLAKRALSPEKEPEKNARVKRLGEGMSAISEESDAHTEGRPSTGRFTRSRGLPPAIPGVRKTLTRRKTGVSASRSLDTLPSAGILLGAAAAAVAAVPDPGAFAQNEGLGVLPRHDRTEGGDSAADGPPALPGDSSASSWSESDGSVEVLRSEGSSDEERGLDHPSRDPQEFGTHSEQNASQPLQPGDDPSKKAAHRRSVSLGSALVSESPPVSPVRTPRAKDPLRASSEDFNVPLPTARPESRLKKGQGRANVIRGTEKENDEDGGTPALLPGGASPIGKGSLFEKQSVASRLRLGSTSGESASKLPTPRRLTMAGTSIPIAPGRVAIHRRSSSIEDALPISVPSLAIPAPPSRLKQPGAAITPSGGASRQSGRRQWV